MLLETLYSLVLFIFIGAITPGPNNIMIMASGLNYGIGKSMPHALGICIGFPIMVLIISFGAGFIFTQLPVIHTLIKIVGVTYIFFLAWMITKSLINENDANAKPLSFFQAVIFQWANPKGWIMIMSAHAAFTTTNGNIYIENTIIFLTFLLSTFPSIAIWLFFGKWLKRWLKRPKILKTFNWVMALLLIFSILPIAVELILTTSGLYYQLAELLLNSL